MDPHARRFTWELLREQRAGRTVALTTHFLDEAEVRAAECYVRDEYMNADQYI